MFNQAKRIRPIQGVDSFNYTLCMMCELSKPA